MMLNSTVNSLVNKEYFYFVNETPRSFSYRELEPFRTNKKRKNSSKIMELDELVL